MVAIPRLLAISDRRRLATHDLARWAEGLKRMGAPALQLREKDLSDRQLFAWAERLQQRVGDRVAIGVNGRPDIAFAAGCAAVHLPADGLPTAAVRARFGRRLLIGRSTHRLAEVEREGVDGADYVTFGPVFESPGKGPPVGLTALRRAAALGIPVLALGGVELSRLEALAAAGAAGVAAVRAFLDPRRSRAFLTAGRRLWPEGA